MTMSKIPTLYLVGTPIGNLEDMTFRAVRILKEVDFIAAEDTRHSKKLLDHFEISTQMISYHEHNEKECSEKIIQKLFSGKSVALITDAGTPCISDPGEVLVQKCIENKIKIEWVPGPCALIGALAVSGLDTSTFMFIGFLSASSHQRKKQLLELSIEKRALIFYESTHRIQEFLEDAKICLGDRKICVARELTKQFETLWYGTISAVIDESKTAVLKGEFTVVIDGASEKINWDHLSFEEHLEKLILEIGLSKKEAMILLAHIRGISKREIYKEISE